MKIPLAWQIAAARIKALAQARQLNAALGQAITRRPDYPVSVYGNPQELSDAMARVTWTPDPWDGNIDLVRHPTWFERAIREHPAAGGDCDDFAVYAIAALIKSGLATEAHLGIATFASDDRSFLDGHAVAVWRDLEGAWWWVSNWKRCKHIRCGTAAGWLVGIEEHMGRPVITAELHKCRLSSTDAVIFGSYRWLRR